MRPPSRPHGRTAALRLAALSSVVAVLTVASGCGGDDPRQVLARAFQKPIDSAVMSLDAAVRLQGPPNVPSPIRLSISGPFQSGAGDRLEQLDWRASLAAGPRTFDGRLVSTGDNAYLGFGGRMFEVGEEQVARVSERAGKPGRRRSLADLGIDASKWLRDADTEEDVTVAGVETTHVSGRIDVRRMLEDLNRVTRRAAGAVGGQAAQLPPDDIARIERLVKEPRLDVYVGKRDGRIRRLATKLRLDVPEEDRARVNGLRTGDVSLTVEFAKVGEPQRISAPADARPISELGEAIAALGSGLPGAAGGAAGGAGPSDPDAEARFEAYARCIERAGDDSAAQRRCQALIQ